QTLNESDNISCLCSLDCQRRTSPIIQVRMMQRTALLLFCCLLLSATCSPVYPLRFGQRAAAILMTSSIEDPMQLPADTSSQTPDTEFRSFIHSFFLFSLSLSLSVNRPETQNFVKRQSGIYGDTFKQDVDMDVIEREQSYREPQRLKFSVVTQ
ncbi:somatoliberin, partial [Cyprinus carpio]|uniref:Somatoliberin n=1 Tax=Cyprinus carpio TaxID=7962 RepID=A0A9Q9YK45_CYPCA